MNVDGYPSRTLRAGLAVMIVTLSAACAAPAPGPTSGLAPDGEAGSGEVFALSSRADLAYRESRWIDAARDYQSLTVQVPRDAYAWFRLGNVYAKQGAYDEAIHAYETSLEHDPDQPKPWFNLSTAYLLSAQAAMARARERLRADDPARTLIESRLESLASIVHGRIEEGDTTLVSR